MACVDIARIMTDLGPEKYAQMLESIGKVAVKVIDASYDDELRVSANRLFEANRRVYRLAHLSRIIDQS